MAKKDILLGYEIETGKEVYIKLSHLVVTGITAESGKTTTLNALIKRSGLKAIMFKTKGGEKAITEGVIIPPYFREKSDWQYVSSLLEATLKEKLKFERSWIMQVCRGTNSLLEVKNNIDEKLANERLNQLSKSVYITLQEYFKLILPQLQTTTFSNVLELREGINIMDLEHYSDEIQSLVIRSVLETVLKEYRGVIVVIPEFWKFAHQKRGNPVKELAENFIRQGATKRNYLWADSQDMANVDKTLLKQVFTWILGLQTERNEVEHTLDQLPLSKSRKPKTEEIMTLKLGHFYLATPEQTAKIYIIPSWLDEKIGKKIAMGKMDVSEIEQPTFIAPHTVLPTKTVQIPEKVEQPSENWRKEIIELRTDFFDKITQIQANLSAELLEIKSMPKEESNIDEIVSLVLQKMPLNNLAPVNEESIINKVLARVPKATGSGATYEVAPLEKIRKDFMEEAKNKILSDVKNLDEEQKKILKFVETQGKGCNQTMILSKCLFVSATSGGTRARISQKCKDMSNAEIMRMDKNAVCYSYLKDRIKILLGTHQASDQEIEQIYSHIMMEML